MGSTVIGVCLGLKNAQICAHADPQAFTYIDPTKINLSSIAPIARR